MKFIENIHQSKSSQLSAKLARTIIRGPVVVALVIALTATICTGFGYSRIYAYQKNSQDTNNNLLASDVSSSNPDQNPVLLSDAQLLGLTIPASLNLVLTSTLPLANDVPSGKAVGVWNASTNTIYVQSGMNKFQELNDLSYEYMHYIWNDVLSTSDKNQQIEYLSTYMANSQTFQQLVSAYKGPQPEMNDEYDATACTRINPGSLSKSFNAYCDQYIANRQTVLFW